MPRRRAPKTVSATHAPAVPALARALDANVADRPPQVCYCMTRPGCPGGSTINNSMHAISGPEAVLIENLQQFIAFARKRVGDPHLAEDLVQESLLKAIQADRKPAR